MAVRTPSPWWLSALFVAGLLAVFLGQRPLAHLGAAGPIATALGAALAVVAAGARAWTASRAVGDGRRAEMFLLGTELAGLAGLAIYALSTDAAVDRLAFESPASEEAYAAAAQAAYAIVLAASLLPKVVVELGLGFARRGRFARAEERAGVARSGVELPKIRELAGSGLTIALAAAFLMVTCHVAGERGARVDVSYFKTSSPGESTQSIARSVSDPIEVLLFFPGVGRVKSEVEGYFEELAARSGGVRVSVHDRVVSADLAREYNVTQDGTILLIYGDRSERVTVSTDFQRARREELRELDAHVQEALLRVIRPPRVAYFTVGHGELNDPDTREILGADEPGMSADLLKRRLATLNYEVRDLGMADGLARGVPDDATIVFSLMPETELLPAAQDSLARYLEDGGNLFMALDPRGEADLGALEGTLGVRFLGTPLADDQMFFPRRRNESDHRLVVTNQVSSHDATSTLARAGPRAELLLRGSGYLENAPLDDPQHPVERTYLIETMPTAFADETGDFLFDEEREERGRYDVAVAVEGPARAGAGEGAAADREGAGENDTEGESDDREGAGEDEIADALQPEDAADVGARDEMRALVFADGDMFSDVMLSQFPTTQILADDAIRWLGGEEEFAGAIERETDVPIEHTRSEDVVLFYGTTAGAPALVLGAGLLWVYWRRRNRTGRPS